jgi:hypothetical protein
LNQQDERKEQRVLTLDAQDQDFQEEILALARELGVTAEADEPTARGLEPVTIALVLLGSARAVAAIVEMVERRRGGQVIDLRGRDAPKITRSRDLQYGLVLLLTDDGQVSVEVHDRGETVGQVIDAIRRLAGELMGKAGDLVLAIIDRSVGDRATVTRG